MADASGAATTPALDPVLGRAVGRARNRLMPFLILIYMLAFLDRANAGVAKQALHAQVGISNAMFALAPASSSSATRCSRYPATSQAIFWTFPTDHFGGLAVINSVGNLGGFVAPTLRAEADLLVRSHAAGLHALSVSALLAALVALLLPARSRRVVAAVRPGFSRPDPAGAGALTSVR